MNRAKLITALRLRLKAYTAEAQDHAVGSTGYLVWMERADLMQAAIDSLTPNEKVLKAHARRIVRKLLDYNLLDRRGFRQEWDGCDQKTKEEIRKSLITDVLANLKEMQ